MLNIIFPILIMLLVFLVVLYFIIYKIKKIQKEKELYKKRSEVITKLHESNEYKEEIIKKQKEFHIENEEKGIHFEMLTGRKFEEHGYKVNYNGLEKGKRDNGIDLICTKENRKTLLIQCKNYSKEKSITHEHIKVFHSNAMKYIKKNNLNENQIELKYAVPKKEVLHISAVKTMMDNYYNCKYIIVN